MKKSRLLGIFFTFAILLVVTSTNAATWTTIDGRVLTQTGTPVCAMVLANGQHMFSCGGVGNYDLYVPLDSDGLITLQVFASGFAPFRQTLTAGQAVGYYVYMDLDTSGRTFWITHNEFPSSRNGWVLVNGNIGFDSTPLCAMILINGQSMFSCNQNLGRYSLEVPLDNNGNVTLQAFVAGFTPYRETFGSQIVPGLSFRSFPSSYFTAGYKESYSLTGSDTAGGTYVGKWLKQTKSQTIFDGMPAIPQDNLVELTNTQTNAFASVFGVSYFSTDLNDRRSLGSESLSDGVISYATSTQTLPLIANIGDFGLVGNYSNSDGTTTSVTWRLENAGNGRAFLFIVENQYYQFGGHELTEEHRFLIAPDGTRLSVTIKVILTADNETMTLFGNRN
jgi:hypothetical protein